MKQLLVRLDPVVREEDQNVNKAQFFLYIHVNQKIKIMKKKMIIALVLVSLFTSCSRRMVVDNSMGGCGVW